MAERNWNEYGEEEKPQTAAEKWRSWFVVLGLLVVIGISYFWLRAHGWYPSGVAWCGGVC